VLTPAAPPVVSAQTATQTWKFGQAVNFTLAANTFTDPQKETLTYAASQASGAALPTWLKFNGATDTFTGTAPSTASSLSLKVTATDTSGLSVAETFIAAIASLASGAGSAGTVLSQLVSTPPTLASPAH